MMDDRPSPDAGFTLLELLAYLLVVSTIGVAMANATTVFNRLGSADSLRLQAVTRVAAGVRTISEDLSRIDPSAASVDGDRRPAFEGTALRIIFRRINHLSGLPTLIRLSITGSPMGTRVVRQTAGAGLAGADALSKVVWSAPVPILEVRNALAFAYRGDGSAPADWIATWTPDRGIPQYIRLEGLAGAVGGLVIPPLIVATRIDADPSCDQSDCREMRAARAEGNPR